MALGYHLSGLSIIKQIPRGVPMPSPFENIKTQVHPHTWKILKQIEALSNEEWAKKKAELEEQQKGKEDPFDKSTLKKLKRTHHVSMTDPHLQRAKRLLEPTNFRRSMFKAHVEGLLVPSHHVQMLGGTVNQACLKLYDMFDQALQIKDKMETVMWGRDIDNALNQAHRASYDNWDDKNGLRMVAKLDYFVRLCYALKELLDDAPTRLKRVQNCSVFPLSTDLPYVSERRELANQCFDTAREQWAKSQHFMGEGEMIAMCAGDAVNHYALGLALLDGRPDLIDKTSSMDTSPREGLTQEVWNFVEHGEELRSNLYKEALKARKQKKAISKAVQDHHASSEASFEPSPTRKM